MRGLWDPYVGMNNDDSFSADEEAVEIPIEACLDLHSFSPRDVRVVVEEYLFQCWEKGLLELRIIHGRGTGTQRAIVHSLLVKNPYVDRFTEAVPEAGGWGATMVRLRPHG